MFCNECGFYFDHAAVLFEDMNGEGAIEKIAVCPGCGSTDIERSEYCSGCNAEIPVGTHHLCTKCKMHLMSHINEFLLSLNEDELEYMNFVFEGDRIEPQLPEAPEVDRHEQTY